MEMQLIWFIRIYFVFSSNWITTAPTFSPTLLGHANNWPFANLLSCKWITDCCCSSDPSRVSSIALCCARVGGCKLSSVVYYGLHGFKYKENFSETTTDAVVFRPEMSASWVSTFLHRPVLPPLTYRSVPSRSSRASQPARPAEHTHSIHGSTFVETYYAPLATAQEGAERHRDREETIINTTNQDAMGSADQRTNDDVQRVLKYKSFPFYCAPTTIDTSDIDHLYGTNWSKTIPYYLHEMAIHSSSPSSSSSS